MKQAYNRKIWVWQIYVFNCDNGSGIKLFKKRISVLFFINITGNNEKYS